MGQSLIFAKVDSGTIWLFAHIKQGIRLKAVWFLSAGPGANTGFQKN